MLQIRREFCVLSEWSVGNTRNPDFFIKLLTVKLLILETIKKRKLSSRSSLNISLPSVLEDTTSLMEDIQLAKCDIDR